MPDVHDLAVEICELLQRRGADSGQGVKACCIVLASVIATTSENQREIIAKLAVDIARLVPQYAKEFEKMEGIKDE